LHLQKNVNDQTIGDLINSLQGKVSWKVGQNNKFDINSRVSDYKHMHGVIDTPKDQDLEYADITVADTIPDEFNSREQWGSMCPSLMEIRDQGSCGSCWAIAAAEAFSDRACIQSNGAITVDYSTDEVMTCCSLLNQQFCGNGCYGGTLAPTWAFLKSHGLVTGGLYGGPGCKPYSQQPCEHHVDGDRIPCDDVPPHRTPKCVDTCTNADYSTPYESDFLKSSSAYKVGKGANKVQQIQTEIMTNGPIEVAFTVYADFMAYTGGVYYHTTGASQGGHAVKMIGWGTDADTGMDYWLITNSWNSDWGENGDFRIRRGTNECGIEGQCYAGMIDVWDF